MSEIHPLTVRSWFSRGWSTLKSRPKQLIGGSVILLIISLVLMWVTMVGIEFVLVALYTRLPLPQLVQEGGNTVKPDLNLALRVGFPLNLLVLAFLLIKHAGKLVVGPPMLIGWCFLCLRLVRGEDARSADVLAGFYRYRAAWATVVLYYLVVYGGIALLVVPGIIWSLMYGFSLFAVMDRQLSAREALRFSGRITKGHKGRLFFLLLLVYLSAPLGWSWLIPELPWQESSVGLEVSFFPAGIIILLIVLLVSWVLYSWLCLTCAAAYDSLVHRQESAEIKGNG